MAKRPVPGLEKPGRLVRADALRDVSWAARQDHPVAGPENNEMGEEKMVLCDMIWPDRHREPSKQKKLQKLGAKKKQRATSIIRLSLIHI